MNGTIMYISGGRWDSLPGTDRLLAEALAEKGPVLWVDQPAPVFRFSDVRKHLRRSLSGIAEAVSPAVERLRLPAPPFFSTRVGRAATEKIAKHCINEAVRRSNRPPVAVVNASPIVAFPSSAGGVRLLHLTDDWLSAADLIGFSPAYLRDSLERNLEEADVVTAVSEGLASKMAAFSGKPVAVLPNGCRRPADVEANHDRQPVAVLVGQLNERLHLGVLESLAAAGVNLLVIGPRTESDPETRRRLDVLLSNRNVDWRGAVSPREVEQLLLTASVGLTPYTDTEFNRSSFPLKTLEYLSAGLPVVATDLPSVRTLKCSSLGIADDDAAFVQLVHKALAHGPNHLEREEMRSVALSNAWDVRAASLRTLIQQHDNSGKVPELNQRRTP